MAKCAKREGVYLLGYGLLEAGFLHHGAVVVVVFAKGLAPVNLAELPDIRLGDEVAYMLKPVGAQDDTLGRDGVSDGADKAFFGSDPHGTIVAMRGRGVMWFESHGFGVCIFGLYFFAHNRQQNDDFGHVGVAYGLGGALGYLEGGAGLGCHVGQLLGFDLLKGL